MSEEKADYVTDALEMTGAGYEKAAIIERPRKTHAVGDSGLEEYQLYGWVKMSAKFCAHIKNLRGAKLAIWLCLALSIDEDGECKLSQKELCEITGYSHTEVIESVKELDEMGFLSVDRSGKKNLYSPVFVAKGKGNSPSKETLVKKLDSTPADSNESSPLLENSVPTSIKKEQEYVNLSKEEIDQAKKRFDDILAMANFPGAKREARVNSILSYLGETFHLNTETKAWREFAKYVDSEHQSKGWDVKQFVSWLYGQKGFDLQFWPPSKMREFYPSAFVKDESIPQYKPLPKDDNTYVPNPNRRTG
jgi:hypothetical protein